MTYNKKITQQKMYKDISVKSTAKCFLIFALIVSSIGTIHQISYADNTSTPDIIVTNGDSNTISMILNDGETLAKKFDFQAGNKPARIASGDFNEDGLKDVIVTNGGPSGDDTLSVFLGDSTGGFSPRTLVDLGYEAGAVAIGDFNGDKHEDLIVSDWGTHGSGTKIQIRLGDGNGIFDSNIVNWQVASAPNSIAVGDFNSDGKLDGAITSWSENKVTIVFGDGDGGITNDIVKPIGNRPHVVQVADFNNDGNQDTVTAHALSDFFTVYLGDGTGKFPNRLDSQTVLPLTWGLNIGDINRDGHVDIVAPNSNSEDGTISTYLGDGTGNLTIHATVQVGDRPEGELAIADFNADGNLDTAVPNRFDNTVSILYGDGSGGFDSTVVEIPVGNNPIGIVADEFGLSGIIILKDQKSCEDEMKGIWNDENKKCTIDEFTLSDSEKLIITSKVTLEISGKIESFGEITNMGKIQNNGSDTSYIRDRINNEGIVYNSDSAHLVIIGWGQTSNGFIKNDGVVHNDGLMECKRCGFVNSNLVINSGIIANDWKINNYETFYNFGTIENSGNLLNKGFFGMCNDNFIGNPIERNQPVEIC